jgi:hypothetical protein
MNAVVHCYVCVYTGMTRRLSTLWIDEMVNTQPILRAYEELRLRVLRAGTLSC